MKDHIELLKICIAAVQREVSLEQSDEVPHAHKEKVSTDKVRDGNYQTADTIFDDNGVVLEKNNIEDIPKAHISIKE